MLFHVRLREAALFAPNAEVSERPAVRDAGIPISDVGGDEFDEAERCSYAGSGEDRRNAGEAELAEFLLFSGDDLSNNAMDPICPTSRWTIRATQRCPILDAPAGSRHVSQRPL